MAQNRRPVRNYDDYYDDRRDSRSTARREYRDSYNSRYDDRYDDRYQRRDDRCRAPQERYQYDEYYDRRRAVTSRQERGYYSDDYDRRRSYEADDARSEDEYDDFGVGFRGMYSENRMRNGTPPRKEKTGMGRKITVVFIVLAFVIVNVILFTTISRITKGDEREERGQSISGSDIVPAQSGSDSAETQETEPVEKSEEEIRTERINEIISGMTAEEKAGQLLLIRRGNKTEEEFRALISKCHVGGVVLFKTDFTDKTKNQVKDYVAALQGAGNGKMLVCVDEEGGSVVRLSGIEALRTEKYKSPQQLYKLGGYDKIKDDTVNKCEFLKSFGINVNFAPVSDVVTDSNGFLYKRAFGKDADKTAKYVSTVVTEMKANQVGSTLKHFPGYGNSKNDTHQGLDHNKKSLGALKSSDLVPFQEGIASGADSIMVTHTVIDDVDKKNPASLSKDCIAVIRDYLGFDGVVITDGLDMGAIIEFCGDSDPCVKAIQAGCDLLCTPTNAEKSYNNLLSAIKNEKISAERLNDSLRRIIGWKIDLGLYD